MTARPLRFLSVCSGIGAPDLAWTRLGWVCVGHSEIDKFPNKVLAARFLGVLNFGDLNAQANWPIAAGDYDVLVGGTPCQSFSVAGKRAGMDDPRGQLLWQYLALAERTRPEWLVWENVPGVLSIDGGRAFGAFLGALAQLGYGFAYRVLDAQHLGVPQRRRRVFVVGHRGDWRRAAAVLFERHSLRQCSAPRKDSASTIVRTLKGGAYAGHSDADPMIISDDGRVRFATPTEHERLQGFPDGWTALGADALRYRALGNSMAVPVLDWIGRRLQAVEELTCAPT